MITCPACQHQQAEGDFYCSNCGARLSSWTELGTPPWGFAPAPLLFNSLFSNPNQPPTLQPRQVALVLREVALPVILEGQTEYLLGRANDEALAPDVDLEPYNGQGLGVSRMHAALRLDRQQVLLMDLGSANGTQLNGAPLTPHEPARLENGDEVRLGRLKLKIYFQL